MPIYEYRCKNCHEDSEVLQGMKDAPVLHCKACGQDTLERLISAAGFRLKGGGWYETDFKTSSDKQKNLSETQTDTTGPTQRSAPTTTGTGSTTTSSTGPASTNSTET